jgi:ATP-dependent Clp protease protease subunit
LLLEIRGPRAPPRTKNAAGLPCAPPANDQLSHQRPPQRPTPPNPIHTQVRPVGQRQYEWVDLWDAYAAQKVVFVRQAVTEDLANQLIAQALYMDSLDQKRIYFWLNCPGGDVVPTLALYDTLKYIRSPTATVCYGQCLGMGGFLLAAGGEKGYRYAMPHSILMMHHPSGVARGQASEIHIETQELVRVRDYISLVTADVTGKPYDEVVRKLSRNHWMSPQEAIREGVIDKVLHTPAPRMPALAPKIDFKRSAGEGGVGDLGAAGFSDSE